MKKVIYVVFCLLYVNFAHAQDNPYAIFGYKVKTILKDEPEHLKVFNKDTTSQIKAFVYDIEAGYLLLHGKNGELLRAEKIEPTEIKRFISTDPLADKMPELTPYRFAKNNPILYIDPNGLLEFKNYEAYQAYAKKNGIDALEASAMGGQGHWLKSDRKNNTDVWSAANSFNLQQENGQNQYTSISQRSAFYGWFSDQMDAKGSETNWPGAAAIVANQMTWMDNPLMQAYAGEDAVKFANAGNKAIFNDVFDNLRNLYNGPVLKGQAAANWDAATLHHEQFDVVQPIYMAQSPATVSLLNSMAKGEGIFGLGLTPSLRFQGNILNPQDRYNHGAGRVTNYFQLHRAYRRAGF
jgi:hypothetical protein